MAGGSGGARDGRREAPQTPLSDTDPIDANTRDSMRHDMQPCAGRSEPAAGGVLRPRHGGFIGAENLLRGPAVQRFAVGGAGGGFLVVFSIVLAGALLNSKAQFHLRDRALSGIGSWDPTTIRVR